MKCILKETCLFPIMTPPTTHPRDYWGGDTKRGEVDFRIHFRWFKTFLHHVFVFFSMKGAGWVGPDP